MNEALTITGALFAVLTALIFNRKDVTDLTTEMKERNAVLSAEMKELRTEVREGFSQLTIRMDRMQSDLSGRIDRVQGDINTFAIVNALHDQRISTLESRAKS